MHLRALKSSFPELPVEECVQVLGAYIKANAKPHMLTSMSKFHTIKTLIDDVGHLPLGIWAKIKIISVKIMPMITYVAELNPWPHKCLDSFSNAILKALWQNRPGWRSAEMLFCCNGDPTMINPHLAVAKSIICGIVNRCRNDVDFFNQWCELCEKRIIKKGMMDLLCSACFTIGLRFVPPHGLQVLDFPVCSFMDFTPKSLTRFLRFAALQALYTKLLSSSSRKDFSNAGSGILDPDLNPLGRRWAKPWTAKKIKLDDDIFLGPWTGAIPTANRLYRANVISSQKCRFCECHYEDVEHLTECEGVKNKLGQIYCPLPDQPNWMTHGIFETPDFLIDGAENGGIDLNQFEISDVDSNLTVWCDGSVLNGDFTFGRTLGAAVIGPSGNICKSHGWRDLWGDSYKAEVIAVFLATTLTNGAITVVTDCKSVLRVFHNIQNEQRIPDNLAHRDVWEKIIQRVGIGPQTRLFLRWVKAHQIDNCGAFESATHDQQMNFLADQVAKQRAAEQCPIKPSIVQSWKTHLHFSRKWLVNLSLLVGQHPIDIQQSEPECPLEDEVVSDDRMVAMRLRYVKWDWGLPVDIYQWQMIDQPIPLPTKWKYSKHAWDVTVKFFQNLKWRCEASCGVSIYELAYHFWKSCHFIPPEVLKDTSGTFMLLPNWLRFFIREAAKIHLVLCPPAVCWQARLVLYSSTNFPYGRFYGGRPHFCDLQLCDLASFISDLPNCGKAAANWKRPLNVIP